MQHQSRKKIILLAVGLLLIPVAVLLIVRKTSFNFKKTPDQLSSFLLQEVKKESGIINLGNFNTIKWDRLYVIGPYASSAVYRDFNPTYKEEIESTGIAMSDDRCLLLLFNGKEMVSLSEVGRDIDFNKAQKLKNNQIDYYAKANAIFNYKRDNGGFLRVGGNNYSNAQRLNLDFFENKKLLTIGLCAVVNPNNPRIVIKNLPTFRYLGETHAIADIICVPTSNAVFFKKIQKKIDSMISIKEIQYTSKVVAPLIGKICTDPILQKEFDIYAFYIRSSETSHESDLSTKVYLPKFPCMIYVYKKTENSNWLLHSKKIVKNWSEFASLKYNIISKKLS